SMLKIKGTQIRQRLNALTRLAYGGQAMALPGQGLDALTNDGPQQADAAQAASAAWLNNRKLSIYGGTNEIQRGIIAGALARR
ncbi:MAG: acyl-CoA dehydrogenase family protein, partial [Paracoccus sp. (in: a-proteobacteria)]|nr:acyl-CoA dehydrogenase family protein [Paracoccus sp. (in: a-proteobacteria)]